VGGGKYDIDGEVVTKGPWLSGGNDASSYDSLYKPEGSVIRSKR
jgi:hypothetical protein